MKIKVSILSILLLYFLSCCSQISENEYLTGPEHMNKSYKFLALGDSYTIGERVDSSERWPVQLNDRLRSAGYSPDKLDIVAKTGWTTFELMDAIDKANLNDEYDLVTLLTGVNNQYRGLDTADYRNEFRQLLNISIGFAGGREQNVIVLSIPDYSVTPFASEMDREKIAGEIDHFNAINLSETKRTDAYYINITSISRMAADDPSLLADDGLHPSSKMYALWVDAILPLVREILNSPEKK